MKKRKTVTWRNEAGLGPLAEVAERRRQRQPRREDTALLLVQFDLKDPEGGHVTTFQSYIQPLYHEPTPDGYSPVLLGKDLYKALSEQMRTTDDAHTQNALLQSSVIALSVVHGPVPIPMHLPAGLWAHPLLGLVIGPEAKIKKRLRPPRFTAFLVNNTPGWYWEEDEWLA